ncbi:MAG TPA: hypothetical protein VL985_16980 [Stellaceae bacterium]|nr:hypothetical protein [Stellaceae bacterium]
MAVLINRQHPLFEALYGPLLKLPNGGQAKQVVDVLLIALARAELAIDDDQAALWYEAQRERTWSPFLADEYKVLQQTLTPADEEATADDGADDQLQAAE